MTQTERIQSALKKAGIERHSQRFGRIEAVLDKLRLTGEEREKAKEIAKEWCR